MNRLVDYKIGGRTMRLNCSVQAALEIGDEYGSIKEVLEQIDEETTSGDATGTEKGIAIAAKLIEKFAQQGKRYCDIVGEACDKPFTADELLVLVPWSSEAANEMLEAVNSAVTFGTVETVATEAPKNAETTPESQAEAG